MHSASASLALMSQAFMQITMIPAAAKSIHIDACQLMTDILLKHTDCYAVLLMVQDVCVC